MDYDLELDRAVHEIRDNNAKLVCIQLPDGLKKYAGEIKDKLESQTNAEILIWLGSCYGACDTPNIEKFDFDLLIQWGHSEWNQ